MSEQFIISKFINNSKIPVFIKQKHFVEPKQMTNQYQNYCINTVKNELKNEVQIQTQIIHRFSYDTSKQFKDLQQELQPITRTLNDTLINKEIIQNLLIKELERLIEGANFQNYSESLVNLIIQYLIDIDCSDAKVIDKFLEQVTKIIAIKYSDHTILNQILSLQNYLIQYSRIKNFEINIHKLIHDNIEYSQSNSKHEKIEQNKLQNFELLIFYYSSPIYQSLYQNIDQFTAIINCLNNHDLELMWKQMVISFVIFELQSIKNEYQLRLRFDFDQNIQLLFDNEIDILHTMGKIITSIQKDNELIISMLSKIVMQIDKECLKVLSILQILINSWKNIEDKIKILKEQFFKDKVQKSLKSIQLNDFKFYLDIFEFQNFNTKEIYELNLNQELNYQVLTKNDEYLNQQLKLKQNSTNQNEIVLLTLIDSQGLIQNSSLSNQTIYGLLLNRITIQKTIKQDKIIVDKSKNLNLIRKFAQNEIENQFYNEQDELYLKIDSQQTLQLSESEVEFKNLFTEFIITPYTLNEQNNKMEKLDFCIKIIPHVNDDELLISFITQILHHKFKPFSEKLINSSITSNSIIVEKLFSKIQEIDLNKLIISKITLKNDIILEEILKDKNIENSMKNLIIDLVKNKLNINEFEEFVNGCEFLNNFMKLIKKVDKTRFKKEFKRFINHTIVVFINSNKYYNIHRVIDFIDTQFDRTLYIKLLKNLLFIQSSITDQTDDEKSKLKYLIENIITCKLDNEIQQCALNIAFKIQYKSSDFEESMNLSIFEEHFNSKTNLTNYQNKFKSRIESKGIFNASDKSYVFIMVSIIQAINKSGNYEKGTNQLFDLFSTNQLQDYSILKCFYQKDFNQYKTIDISQIDANHSSHQLKLNKIFGYNLIKMRIDQEDEIEQQVDRYFYEFKNNNSYNFALESKQIYKWIIKTQSIISQHYNKYLNQFEQINPQQYITKFNKNFMDIQYQLIDIQNEIFSSDLQTQILSKRNYEIQLDMTTFLFSNIQKLEFKIKLSLISSFISISKIILNKSPYDDAIKLINKFLRCILNIKQGYFEKRLAEIQSQTINNLIENLENDNIISIFNNSIKFSLWNSEDNQYLTIVEQISIIFNYQKLDVSGLFFKIKNWKRKFECLFKIYKIETNILSIHNQIDYDKYTQFLNDIIKNYDQTNYKYLKQSLLICILELQKLEDRNLAEINSKYLINSFSINEESQIIIVKYTKEMIFSILDEKVSQFMINSILKLSYSLFNSSYNIKNQNFLDMIKFLDMNHFIFKHLLNPSIEQVFEKFSKCKQTSSGLSFLFLIQLNQVIDIPSVSKTVTSVLNKTADMLRTEMKLKVINKCLVKLERLKEDENAKVLLTTAKMIMVINLLASNVQGQSHQNSIMLRYIALYVEDDKDNQKDKNKPKKSFNNQKQEKFRKTNQKQPKATTELKDNPDLVIQDPNSTQSQSGTIEKQLIRMFKLIPSTIKNTKQYDKQITILESIINLLKQVDYQVFYSHLNLILLKLSKLLTDESETIRIKSRDILNQILTSIDRYFKNNENNLAKQLQDMLNQNEIKENESTELTQTVDNIPKPKTIKEVKLILRKIHKCFMQDIYEKVFNDLDYSIKSDEIKLQTYQFSVKEQSEGQINKTLTAQMPLMLSELSGDMFESKEKQNVSSTQEKKAKVAFKLIQFISKNYDVEENEGMFFRYFVSILLNRIYKQRSRSNIGEIGRTQIILTNICKGLSANKSQNFESMIKMIKIIDTQFKNKSKDFKDGSFNYKFESKPKSKLEQSELFAKNYKIDLKVIENDDFYDNIQLMTEIISNFKLKLFKLQIKLISSKITEINDIHSYLQSNIIDQEIILTSKGNIKTQISIQLQIINKKFLNDNNSMIVIEFISISREFVNLLDEKSLIKILNVLNSLQVLGQSLIDNESIDINYILLNLISLRSIVKNSSAKLILTYLSHLLNIESKYESIFTIFMDISQLDFMTLNKIGYVGQLIEFLSKFNLTNKNLDCLIKGELSRFNKLGSESNKIGQMDLMSKLLTVIDKEQISYNQDQITNRIFIVAFNIEWDQIRFNKSQEDILLIFIKVAANKSTQKQIEKFNQMFTAIEDVTKIKQVDLDQSILPKLINISGLIDMLIIGHKNGIKLLYNQQIEKGCNIIYQQLKYTNFMQDQSQIDSYNLVHKSILIIFTKLIDYLILSDENYTTKIDLSKLLKNTQIRQTIINTFNHQSISLIKQYTVESIKTIFQENNKNKFLITENLIQFENYKELLLIFASQINKNKSETQVWKEIQDKIDSKENLIKNICHDKFNLRIQLQILKKLSENEINVIKSNEIISTMDIDEADISLDDIDTSLIEDIKDDHLEGIKSQQHGLKQNRSDRENLKMINKKKFKVSSKLNKIKNTKKMVQGKLKQKKN